tara:strand:- start:407 stop:715 length:309 start_codon:yes stop_codon:yes gene_type:complete
MSKFSEAAGLPTTSHETGTTAPPVTPVPTETVVPPTPPVYENPLDDMPVSKPTAGDIPKDLKWMSKIKLEQIGRTLGIELDRRLSQPKLVEQLENHITSLNG